MRRQAIAARAALPATLHAAHSACIEAALEAELDALGAVTSAGLFTPQAPTYVRRLGFCWPHQGEFDARPLVQRLLAQGWTACLPVVVAADEALAFRPWTPDTALAPDRYGIPTPTSGEFVDPDVLLIPLVAFDSRNYRIGYGGGFFDRTLADLAARGHATVSIGVGFELARVADTLPGPHDIALDRVITEGGCCKAPGMA